MTITRVLVLGRFARRVRRACLASAQGADPLENVLLLDLKDGRVTILLRPDLAPKHVERVKKAHARGLL